MVLLRLLNLMLLLGLVVCLGAMAGLIVFAPFVGGAWFARLLAIVGFEPHSPAAGGRNELPAPQAMPRREAA